MVPERHPPDDPREWMNRANSNMAQAKAGYEIQGVYLEDLCFDAQQAAEKAIKAVLLHRNVSFPYIHDLAELLTLVERSGDPAPAPVHKAGRLTRFAIATRYPSPQEPVTREEYANALTIAETVVRWAEEQIGVGR